MSDFYVMKRTTMRPTKMALRRFRSLYRKRGANKCWEWKTGNGSHYPVFWTGVKCDGGHRFALEQKLGRLLVSGECTLHTCDNKKCVNPNHLFVGTNDDNSKDMVRKGRKECGAEVASSKLTEEQVLAIRKEFNPLKIRPLDRLARKYGVTSGNISAIVRGVTWRHVGGPLHKGAQLKRGSSSRLNRFKVREMRRLFATGKYSIQDLARLFSVDRSTASLTVRYLIWKEV